MQFPSPSFFKMAVLCLVVPVIAGCGGTASSPASAVVAASTVSPTQGSSSPAQSAAPPPASSSPTPTPSPAPAPSAAPTPSPTASTPTGKLISAIEQMPGWESCDTCSGGGPIAYSMTEALSYPQPATTRFSIGEGAAWGHALWWRRMGNDPSISHFVLTLDQYIENPAVSWGTEYNVNQIIDGGWYNLAVQCSFGLGIWQVWDPANQHWVPTSVPCARPAPSSHVQLRLEFARNNGQAIFVSIGMDGNNYPLNMAFNPIPINGLNGDFGVSFQLNTDGNPDPYSVWVHNLSLNYW